MQVDAKLVISSRVTERKSRGMADVVAENEETLYSLRGVDGLVIAALTCRKV